MKYIYEPGSELSLSQIGLGTGRFGTIVSEEDAFMMMNLFLRKGGNVIDTARNYYEWVENGRGKSEACIGKWMSKYNTRDKVCICTKGGVRNEGKKWYIDLSKKTLLDELNQSLATLQTDYIDIYLLHRDEKERNVGEIIENLNFLKEQGNISCIGVANWSTDRIIEANKYADAHSLCPIQVIQTWWSLAEYTKEMWNDENTTHMDEQMYQYMLKKSILGMAYTSQCKGYFQKKKLGDEYVSDLLRKRIETDTNKRKAQFISEYCDNNDITPTEMVLGYITSNPINGIALVSCSNEKQLYDVLEHCDYIMPQNVIDKIDSIC